MSFKAQIKKNNHRNSRVNAFKKYQTDDHKAIEKEIFPAGARMTRDSPLPPKKADTEDHE